MEAVWEGARPRRILGQLKASKARFEGHGRERAMGADAAKKKDTGGVVSAWAKQMTGDRQAGGGFLSGRRCVVAC